MAKFQDLPAKTVPSDGDILAIADSAASNASKRITRAQLLSGAPLPADTIDTQAIEDDAVTAPKIVGIDKSNLTTDSNPYKFSAYRNAALIINAPVAVGFDTELFDTNNNFDVTTNKGRYTAPVNGFYAFQAAITANSGSGYHYIMYFKKNGTTDINRVDEFDSTSTNYASHGAIFVQLTAGDYLEVYFSSVTGATNLLVGSQEFTWFSGFLVCRT